MTDVAESVAAPESTAQGSTFVLDLGKKKRKSVKKLRKGRGKLLDSVRDTIDQLRAEGQLSESGDTVIVVVKQKSKAKGLFF